MQNFTSGFRADPRPTEELVRSALTANTEDEYWEKVELLNYRGTTEVFEAASRLCRSGNPQERKLGAYILGYIGGYKRFFLEEAVDVLIPLLEDDSQEVLQAALEAIGRRKVARAIPLILRFKSHPNPDIRRAAAFALNEFDSDELEPETYGAIIEALVELSSDNDRDTRLKATTALVFVEQNELVLTALRHRVDDEEDAEIRGNALLGLAYQHYPDVVDLLINELSNNEWIYDDALDAATIVADPRLLPILLQLKQEGIGGMFIDEAIKACSAGNDEER